MMTNCEWSGCSAVATHTVTLTFPSEPVEVWHLCRAHDREIKNQAVASRPKAEPKPESEPTVEVCCASCDRTLDEPQSLPADERKPCPACGSLGRLIKVGISDTLTMHASVRVRSKSPGKGGWLVDQRSGADYTRLLEGWGSRELTTDRPGNRYREVIELHDGTRIESEALLTDHQ